MSVWSYYLSIPFRDRGLTPAGCDCYGLVRLILSECAGIALPDFLDIAPGAYAVKARTIMASANSTAWHQIQAGTEQKFDVVLMRGQFRAEGRMHSRPVHIGLVTRPGELIHTEEGSGVTIVNYRDHHMIRSRVESFWRYSA